MTEQREVIVSTVTPIRLRIGVHGHIPRSGV
jgi:hypothetical protein